MANQKILQKYSIVYFSPSDWWFGKTDWTHLTIEFSKHSKVLFINTISPSLPSIKSANFLRRLKRKLPSLLRIFRKPLPNIYVFTPFVLPFSKYKLLQKINALFLPIQLRTLMFLLGFNKTIFWVSNLAAAPLLKRLKYELLVYSCTDKFDATRYVKAKKQMSLFDEMLVQQADIILCVSRALYRYYKQRAGNVVHYLSHAVDFNHFNNAYLNASLPPAEMQTIPKPIIGYYGSLTDSNDLEILFYCAQRRPEWSFVLIGKITGGDFRKIQQLPNVYMPGYKRYEELPRYAVCFDVCLLFWKITEWIKFCSPYKTKEYLAMGKPVVSVPIPEIMEEFSDIISVAKTKEEFLNAIEDVLNNDTQEKQEARISKVREFTWENYVTTFSSILEFTLEKKNEKPVKSEVSPKCITSSG